MSVKNFVQCGLVTPVAANTTELVLMAPTASYQYPPLDGGTLVIADSVARPSFYEIISYTHRIENVLYGVVRAKEGTTARAWSGVTWIYQALTAQDYVDALALKAPLASPALTGVPTAPTAPLGTNTQQIATMAAVQAAIANLVASSPAALDTLNELAAALGNDPNFATTMNNALAGKEPTIAAGTSAQMWLGNKTWASVLTQVQNTLLTGLGAGSNATILTTDTLIGALAKIQNQLNNKANFTDPRLSDAREWTATEVSQAEAEAGTATVPRKWSALRVWQAVLASSLTGLNLTVGTAVTATDTVLVAIGKLQKQITDAAANFAGTVRATVLTGYVSGSNAVLASTDTVLAAFGKVQAQITALATSKLDSNANAVSASKLVTARTIALTGDVAGSASFDGSANVLINAQVANDSHTHSLGNLGLGNAATANVQTSPTDTTAGAVATTEGARFAVLANYGAFYNSSAGKNIDTLAGGESGLFSNSNPGTFPPGFGSTVYIETQQNYHPGSAKTQRAWDYSSSSAPVGRHAFRVCSREGEWSPWRVCYHTGNILGTVSQSGGIPTGAIIERGSNANGEYVRYADGTQICTSEISITSNQNNRAFSYWYFPATFAVAPWFVSITPNIGFWFDAGWPFTNISGTSYEALNTTSVLLHVASTVFLPPGSIGGNKCYVIGRWY